MPQVKRHIRHYVFIRDEYVCQLCFEDIDPKAVGRQRATVDHIVPWSLGGGSRAANLRTAHYGCNQDRRNDSHPTDQATLLLIQWVERCLDRLGAPQGYRERVKFISRLHATSVPSPT